MTAAGHNRNRLQRRPKLESLESRQLFSIGGAQPPLAEMAPFGQEINAWTPASAAEPAAAATTGDDTRLFQTAESGVVSPQPVRHAYGLDRLNFNGAPLDGNGQTIAIIEVDDDQNIADDLRRFDSVFGLPDPPGFHVVAQRDQNGNPPPAGDGLETALDVEWAHAMAPGANILVVEGNPNDYPNDPTGGLAPAFNAADWARQQPGVSVVTMSLGLPEFDNENQYDGIFTTPRGHEGVTFIASSGDRDAGHGYTPSIITGMYPAASPNVVAVGATVLTSDGQGGYDGETSDTISGGGVSPYEAEPSYQVDAGITSFYNDQQGVRATPDVAWADATSDSPGLTICNAGEFTRVNGTSASAPQFAGLIAIADQGRVLAGENTLDGPTQTLPLLYQLPNIYHDIVQPNETSNGQPFQPTPGYDLTTGMGSPVGEQLIADLVAGRAVTLPSSQPSDPGSPSSPPPSSPAPSSPAPANPAPAQPSDPAPSPSAPTDPASDPMSEDSAYVSAVFEAVLSRAPYLDELDAWTQKLVAGLSRADFVNALDHSDEYYATIIRPAYERYLGREADAAGISYWTNQMRAGLTDEQLEAKFIASDEFYRNAGGTDRGWVDSLYQHLLGRGADVQGEDYWLAHLAGGEARFDVAFGFTGGLERETHRIQDDYFRYLGRSADESGVDYWVNQFAHGQTNEDLITGFVASDEYFQTHSA